jgi:NADPH:quinone reductase-like Zn-dependent oxidoreductase
MRFPVKWFVWALRLGWGVRRPRRRNRVLGGYWAGEVAACGAGVTRFRAGDRVFGCAGLRMGAYAEYAVYPQTNTIARLPDGVSEAAGAASLLGGLNALHFLNLAAVGEGDELLIVGGGGSIGLAAIQIGKARGARVTVVDKPEKETLIRTAGADRFIDCSREDFAADGARWDVVFSMPVGVTLATCLGAVRAGGRVMLGNPRFADLLRGRFGKPNDGKRVGVAFARESQEELDALAAMLEGGALRPIIDRVMPLQDAAEAHRRVESEARMGAVVLAPHG